MDYFELAPNPGDLAKSISKTDARFLVVSYDTDWLFTTAQSKEIVSALLSQQKHVSYSELSSPYGHDSFLIELDQLGALVKPFLEQTLASTRG